MKQKVPMIMWDEDAAIYNYREICKLSRKLETSERTVALLTRLVERMGEAVDTLTEWYCNDGALLLGGHIDTTFPLTVIGQRERDAAMHDAEGAPETRESTGAHGYGGPGL